MSNRQMARMYSGRTNGLSPQARQGFADLDLFGVQKRKRAREQQEYKDIERFLRELEEQSALRINKAAEEDERKTYFDKAIIDILKAEGIQPTPENISAFNAGTSSNKLNRANTRSQIDLNNARSELGVQTGKPPLDLTPGFNSAINSNIMATLYAPSIKNMKEGAFSSGPGELVTIPRGPGIANFDTSAVLHGSGEQQNITEEGGITDPNTGITYNAKPMVTRKTIPGRISRTLDPSILEQVSNMSEEALSTTPDTGFTVDPGSILSGSLDSILGGTLNTKPVLQQQQQQQQQQQMPSRSGINRNIGKINIPKIEQEPFSLMDLNTEDDKALKVLQFIKSLGY